MKNGERVTTLTRLGLTLNEARAYLALVMQGATCAQKISDASHISKQDIYRVMLSLEQTGIVEKTVVRPTVYKAAPIEQVTQILLQRQMAQQKDLQEKADDLVASLRDSCVEGEITQNDFEVIMIPGKELIISRLKCTLRKTQESLRVVSSRERFAPALIEFQDFYRNALERGVKIQIATEMDEPEAQVLSLIRDFSMNEGFEARSFKETPESLVSIFDGREAAVAMSTTANASRAQALWSNDPAFVALAQSYFRNIWNKSAKIF